MYENFINNHYLPADHVWRNDSRWPPPGEERSRSERSLLGSLLGSGPDGSSSSGELGINFAPLDMRNISFGDVMRIWGRASDIEVAWKGAIVAAICAVGLVGNFLVIFLVWRQPKMRRQAVNIYIVNLAIADFLTTAFTPINALLTNIYQNYELGPVMCKLEILIKMMCILASIFSVVAISFQRFSNIRDPIRGRGARGFAICTARPLLVIAVIWMAAIVCATPLAMWRTYQQRQWKDYLEKWCTEDPPELSIKYWIVWISPLMYVPLVVLIVMYWLMIVKINRFIRRLQPNPIPNPNINATNDDSLRDQLYSHRNNIIFYSPTHDAEIENRNKNRNRDRDRIEIENGIENGTTAATTIAANSSSGSHHVMSANIYRRSIMYTIIFYCLITFVLWLPLQILVYYRAFKPKVWTMGCWYENIKFLANILCSINSAINPFVTFRKTFAQLYQQFVSKQRHRQLRAQLIKNQMKANRIKTTTAAAAKNIAVGPSMIEMNELHNIEQVVVRFVAVPQSSQSINHVFGIEQDLVHSQRQENGNNNNNNNKNIIINNNNNNNACQRLSSQEENESYAHAQTQIEKHEQQQQNNKKINEKEILPNNHNDNNNNNNNNNNNKNNNVYVIKVNENEREEEEEEEQSPTYHDIGLIITTEQPLRKPMTIEEKESKINSYYQNNKKIVDKDLDDDDAEDDDDGDDLETMNRRVEKRRKEARNQNSIQSPHKQSSKSKSKTQVDVRVQTNEPINVSIRISDSRSHDDADADAEDYYDNDDDDEIRKSQKTKKERERKRLSSSSSATRKKMKTKSNHTSRSKSSSEDDGYEQRNKLNRSNSHSQNQNGKNQIKEKRSPPRVLKRAKDGQFASDAAAAAQRSIMTHNLTKHVLMKYTPEIFAQTDK